MVSKILKNYQSKTSGTTSLPEITWSRKGDVVVVEVKSERGFSITNFTGLPTPDCDYASGIVIYGTGVSGYVIWNGHNWAINCSGGGYGSVTYIAQ